LDFAGEFESHLTVRTADNAGLDELRTWAVARGLKFLHIVLDRGRTPSQPMVTRRARGTLIDQRTVAADLARQLAGRGLDVVRTKIEAAPWNRDVPEADPDAVARHAGRYFEHHVKLALDPVADVAALADIAGRHAAHLSRNALRDRADGRRERFVTQRCFRVGRGTARRRLDDLLAALAVEGYVPLSVEQEFVVYDSDLAVDAGWIEAPDPPETLP
jgi:hypothetical protein